ncbi:MAG: hypothetical protein PHQ66_03600 [Candidatus Nanoarchaeia archaeon]|nr:hypothetical protein [Candidatus Nanoarchaeia archaeon]MDD5357553.1 hypothetical protein [Candidatus Nanoarchaeia archaeon]MDD5588472.1 hypothetical protein [Candidatus Nanoarchaeia archaeon]
MGLEKHFTNKGKNIPSIIAAFFLASLLSTCPVDATKPTTKYKIPLISYATSRINSQIAVMNEDGSDFQEITSDSPEKNYPRLSPDRDKIIFELHKRNGTDISTLYTINFDGSELTELVGSSEATNPSWSSQDKIAFVAQWGLKLIYLADLDFSSRERLTTTQISEYTPSFSPDGNDLVYSSAYKDIVKINLASREKTILVLGDNNTTNAEPEFSSDGKKIAFASYIYSSGKLVDVDICVYDVNSSNIEKIIYPDSIERSPHFSKDGSKILFSSNADGTYQIYSVSVDGSEKKQLTQGPNNHTFGYYR